MSLENNRASEQYFRLTKIIQNIGDLGKWELMPTLIKILRLEAAIIKSETQSSLVTLIMFTQFNLSMSRMG